MQPKFSKKKLISIFFLNCLQFGKQKFYFEKNYLQFCKRYAKIFLKFRKNVTQVSKKIRKNQKKYEQKKQQ